MTQKENLNKYIEEFIKPCIKMLYDNEGMLFEYDLSERCIAFRFAYHLQSILNDKIEASPYFVDCDYNSRTEYDPVKDECVRHKGKKIKDLLEDREDNATEEMKSTGRFIDIIVHQRSCNIDEKRWSDLFCLEIKKWNNTTEDRVQKDRHNLVELTSYYGYKYGFHLVFGKTKEETNIEVFRNGESVTESFPLFK